MCFVDLLFSVRFRLEFIANATTNVQNEKKGKKKRRMQYKRPNATQVANKYLWFFIYTTNHV